MNGSEVHTVTVHGSRFVIALINTETKSWSVWCGELGGKTVSLRFLSAEDLADFRDDFLSGKIVSFMKADGQGTFPLSLNSHVFTFRKLAMEVDLDHLTSILNKLAGSEPERVYARHHEYRACLAHLKSLRQLFKALIETVGDMLTEAKRS